MFLLSLNNLNVLEKHDVQKWHLVRKQCIICGIVRGLKWMGTAMEFLTRANGVEVSFYLIIENDSQYWELEYEQRSRA